MFKIGCFVEPMHVSVTYGVYRTKFKMPTDSSVSIRSYKFEISQNIIWIVNKIDSTIRGNPLVPILFVFPVSDSRHEVCLLAVRCCRHITMGEYAQEFTVQTTIREVLEGEIAIVTIGMIEMVAFRYSCCIRCGTDLAYASRPQFEKEGFRMGRRTGDRQVYFLMNYQEHPRKSGLFHILRFCYHI
jgi:hypothetical protein